MKIKQKVVIYGAGGHGKVVADIFDSLGIKILGFFDQNKGLIGKSVHEWKILGNLDAFIKKIKDSKINYFIAIGDNLKRQQITKKVQKMTQYPPLNCIASTAIISPHIVIGAGVFIGVGAIVNVDVKIGNGVIINTAASIDHDSILFDFCSIQPGVHLAGNVTIGKRAMVGIGASALQNLKIGPDAVVAGGAMVIKDVPENSLVKGVPAKVQIL